jgi:hypothetical protein
MDEDQHVELFDLCPERAEPGVGQLRSTLPPIDTPRSPYFSMPSTNCSTARSGCWSATVATATKRSGMAALTSASFSFWTGMSVQATSRSAVYQNGLMLSASTSMPCSSMARNRSVGWAVIRTAASVPVSDQHRRLAPRLVNHAPRNDPGRHE